MAKTLSQLMTEALTQSGLDVNSFEPQCRSWVNTILNTQCRNGSWDYYKKTWADQPFITGQTIYTPLPTDFARPDLNIYLVQFGQRAGLIKMFDRGVWEVMRQQTPTGTPQVCCIEWDYTNGAQVPSLLFDAVPSLSIPLYFRMPYFRLATEVALDGTDDSKIPDFHDQNFLLEELKKMAFEHQDDERYTQKVQTNAEQLRQNKLYANMAQSSKILLAPELFPPGYKGPGSNQGGNGWMGP